MSNMAGKTYAINVVTPVGWRGIVNRAIFLAVQTRFFANRLNGLLTLSLIHYARWVIVGPNQFPNLGDGQPTEELSYAYEFFFSNFNGSWNQYIDSFSMSISSGLDLFWRTSRNFPKSVPIEAFHRYITDNQVFTDHYYSAYPLATSNDVKSAQRVGLQLQSLSVAVDSMTPADFRRAYNAALLDLQHDLSAMDASPIVSLANLAVVERRRVQQMSPT